MSTTNNKCNPCIGIISYFPDKSDVRNVRISRLNKLLNVIDSTFNIPIIIIAQNWRDGEIDAKDNVSVYYFDKLGITGAREKLRQTFINETDYSHIICLDDDFELSENSKLAKIYLHVIESNSDKIIEYGNYLMNLCVIPRDIYEAEAYDTNINAEDGTGFEDWIYINYLQKKYPKRYRCVKDFQLAAKKRSELVEDQYSTWITKDTDKSSIDKASRQIISRNTRALQEGGIELPKAIK